jgi:hypothetical protein
MRYRGIEKKGERDNKAELITTAKEEKPEKTYVGRNEWNSITDREYWERSGRPI